MPKFAILFLTVILLAAACGDGAGPQTTGAPTMAPTTTAAPPTPHLDRGDVPLLFDVGAVTVGDESWTVALAVTPQQRAQGLMGVTDLGDLDGMLFVFDADTAGGFWMKDTLLELEIAFFAADGALVEVLAMVPCDADPCPVYQPAGRYRYALEATPGRLGDLPGNATLVIAG